jgi:hypothetical protein
VVEFIKYLGESMKHSISYQRIKNALIKNKCWESIQKYKNEQPLVPIFFEGLNPDGTVNSDEVNLFNDLCVLVDFEKESIKNVFLCTTEPGWKFRRNPLSSDGWAMIDFGYQRCWKIGSHVTKTSNQYPALIQTGGAVKVWRNKLSNGNRKTGKLFIGWYGINIHTTNNDDVDFDVSVVNGWSAGCLVFPNAFEFYEEFMSELVKLKCEIFGCVVLPESEY